MSERAHTPGPWGFEYTEDNKRIIIGKGLVEGPDGYDVAEVYSDDCPYEEAEANARLIAAAPELLHEIKHLVRLLEPLEQDGTLNVPGLASLNGARAAIAKAEGR